MSFASLGSAASLVEEPADNQVYVKVMVYYEKTIPVHMQSVDVLCNQLLRSGTSIGAKTRTCSLIPVGS